MAAPIQLKSGAGAEEATAPAPAPTRAHEESGRQHGRDGEGRESAPPTRLGRGRALRIRDDSATRTAAATLRLATGPVVSASAGTTPSLA